MVNFKISELIDTTFNNFSVFLLNKNKDQLTIVKVVSPGRIVYVIHSVF